MRTTPLLVGALAALLAGLAAVSAQDRPPSESLPPVSKPIGVGQAGIPDETAIECTIVDMYAHLSGKRDVRLSGEGPIGARLENPIAGFPAAQVFLLVFDPDDALSAVAYHSASRLVGKQATLLGRVLTRDGVSAFQVMGVETMASSR
ncbi:MAG: hypothetical protein JNK58_05805 [Phycisphaerae bacterium]|nr:hypothetical protein [Phycisphaerae bacterium]